VHADVYANKEREKKCQMGDRKRLNGKERPINKKRG
jgi:hypothetical protein